MDLKIKQVPLIQIEKATPETHAAPISKKAPFDFPLNSTAKSKSFIQETTSKRPKNSKSTTSDKKDG